MRAKTRRALALALGIGVGLGAAGDARAYVRSTTDSGVPVYWGGNCAVIFPDTTPPASLTAAQVVDGLNRSIANWQNVTRQAGCSYLSLSAGTAEALETRLDRKNVLKFRSDRWCRPAEKNTPEMCYSAQAAAITTVFYSTDAKRLGLILDADIEMNAVNFTFVNIPTTTQASNRADFENTLTHELGHFQGLDHTCWDGATATPPLDDTGQPIPSCSNLGSLPAAERLRITTATMYNFASADETIKRTPEADDINGICSVYPAARDPGQCLRPDLPASGCAVAAVSSKPALSWIVLVAGALAIMGLGMRRRRSVMDER